jgi:glyoxylate utilization-related uncharacterized protein
MARITKDTATHEDHGPVADWREDVDGYACNFVQFKQDIDSTPMLKGLPDDRCQCPHWGYVISGRVTYGFGDHEETIEAGEAFYVPPGHTQRADAGTEMVQFSPSEALDEVSNAIMTNMKAMMQGA